jgi:hypothetical protein
VHRLIAWRCWSFQNFNLAAIVDVLGDLGEIAHVEPPVAAGGYHVVLRLGRRGVVSGCSGITHSGSALFWGFRVSH